MQWMILSWALTCGWLPASSDAIVYPGYNLFQIYHIDSISTKFEINADAWNHVRLWGSMETRESFTGGFISGAFAPYEGYFIAGAAIHVPGFEIGISHECDHGIDFTFSATPWISSGNTEVYVKISGRTSF